MTMWKIWKGLKHPEDAHPMYRRIQDEIYDDATRISRLIQHVFLQGQIWLWPLLFIIDMRLVCLMVLSGTLSGIVLTLRISNRIANEQQSRTYDLLCLTPDGTIRMLWAICTGCLHREQAFDILNSQEAWIVRLGMFLPFVISSQLLLERMLGLKGGVTVIWAVGFVVLFYIDHVQATVFGCLSGMLAAQHRSNINQRLWSAVTFAGFQIGTYLLTLFISIFVLPAISRVLTLIGIQAELSHVLLTVALFYFVREGMIVLGWRRLLTITNAQPHDITFLAPKSIYIPYTLRDDPQPVART